MSGRDGQPDLTASLRSDSLQSRAITLILALTLGLLGGAAIALYERSRPSNYHSAATLLIDQPLVIATIGNDGPLAKLQRLRYQYVSVLNTDVVAEPVARQLHQPAAVLEGEVIGFADPATFTIRVVSSTKNQADASPVAQAFASQLASYVDDQQAKQKIGTTDRVRLTEVSSPLPGVRARTSQQKELLSAAAGFVVIVAAFLVMADVLIRRPR